MSWLTELAGKAEALLDRVDQVAAASLQGASPAKEAPSLVTVPPRADFTSAPTLERYPTEVVVKRSTPLPGSDRNTREQTTPRTTLSQKAKQPPSDEALLNFLNSPSKETAGKGAAQKGFTPKRALQTTLRPVPAAAPAQLKNENLSVGAAVADKNAGERHVRCI